MNPAHEPRPDGGSFRRKARQLVVTESFETCEGLSDVMLAHTVVELLCPANALRPPESRRARPEIGEVASLGAVQDREDLACGEVLGRQRWDAIDLLKWKQGR